MGSLFAGRKKSLPSGWSLLTISRRDKLARVVTLGTPGILLALLYGPLCFPQVALATRDIPFFHLPLRSVFREIVLSGVLPVWNPWISGGQPILSNPNYAAFYPPTWLVLPLPPTYALNLLAIAHGLWAFLGCFFLCRALGTTRRAAVLGALGFAAGGAYLSLLHAFNFFCGMAWFPWVLCWALPAIRGEGRTLRSILASSAALALMLCAGEPVAVLITGTALACLGLTYSLPLGGRLLRLAAIAALAALFAATQLVPTWLRLKEGPRGEGMEQTVATAWSAPPVRLVELVFPRVFGEANRDEENLYFGWGIHDRDFPYVIHLSPGLLLVILAAAALFRWPIPHRWAWLLCAFTGIFLGLGRYNPAYQWLLENVGLFGLVRYPEKFLVLTFASLAVAGALAWQHLEERVSRREGGDVHFPLALAGTVAALALGLLLLVWWVPRVAERFMESHSGFPPTAEILAKGLSFLRLEAAFSAALSLSVVGLLLALWKRPEWARTLSLLALVVLSVDLWHHHRGLVAYLPSDELLDPPEILSQIPRDQGRVFTNVPFDKSPEINLRMGEPGFQQTLTRRARLDPYSALLWNRGYALNRDYDYMMTRWAQVVFQTVQEEWQNPGAVLNILGAWGVGSILIRRSPRELLEELRERGGDPSSKDGYPLPAAVDTNPYRLRDYRLVENMTLHRSLEAAREALRAQDFVVARSEHLVAPEVLTRGQPIQCSVARDLEVLVEESGFRKLAYDSQDSPCLIVATTFDQGWEAEVEDETVPTYATALGQMALILPPGDHVLELRYRDPWVSVGAGMSTISLLLLLLLAVDSKRRRLSAG